MGSQEPFGQFVAWADTNAAFVAETLTATLAPKRAVAVKVVRTAEKGELSALEDIERDQAGLDKAVNRRCARAATMHQVRSEVRQSRKQPRSFCPLIDANRAFLV